MAVAIYSALTGVPVDNKAAITGEISIRGYVKPVGGIVAKVAAARQAGANTVLIPKDNWQEMFRNQTGFKVIPVETVEELFELALLRSPVKAAASDSGTL